MFRLLFLLILVAPAPPGCADASDSDSRLGDDFVARVCTKVATCGGDYSWCMDNWMSAKRRLEAAQGSGVVIIEPANEEMCVSTFEADPCDGDYPYPSYSCAPHLRLGFPHSEGGYCTRLAATGGQYPSPCGGGGAICDDGTCGASGIACTDAAPICSAFEDRVAMAEASHRGDEAACRQWIDLLCAAP